MITIKKSTAVNDLPFLMVGSADHVTGKTGLTPTVTISKNGAALAAPTGAITEVGNGWYTITANATDSNTLGPILLHATGTAADPTDIVVAQVVDNIESDSYAIVNHASYGNAQLVRSSTPANALKVDANNRAEALLGAITHTGAVIPTVTTLTGHTAQTGDSFARIGLNGAGLSNISLPNQTMNITGNLSGSVGSVTGAVGSISGVTFPTNFGDLAITATVGTVLLKAATHTGAVIPTVSTLTGHTAQTGDSYARLGAPAGVSVSADNAAIKNDSASIKAKTDSLTYTVAGQVDANIQSVNDVTVTGTGAAADEWGP